MTAPELPPTRWCATCRQHVEPAVTYASDEHEGRAVHLIHESCLTCESVVAETVTGPGAHAWALAQGIEVRT